MLANYQSRVDEWIKQKGVRYFNEMTNLAILMEEVGELSRLFARKYGEQSFKKEDDKENVDRAIEDELADIYFVLTCLANQMDIDLNSAIELNFTKKDQRDSLRHFENEKLKKDNIS
jgi:NTP pyrophosphatase (non-canonical NTP hydrolase)